MEIKIWYMNKGKWVPFLIGISPLCLILACVYLTITGRETETDFIAGILLYVMCVILEILYLFSLCFVCKKWIIDSFGCTFVFPFFEKRYRWSELKICWRKKDPNNSDIEFVYMSTMEYPHSGTYFEKYRANYPLTTFYIYFAPNANLTPSVPVVFGYKGSWLRYLDTYVNSIYKEPFFTLLEYWGVEVVDISGYTNTTMKWREISKLIKKQSKE